MEYELILKIEAKAGSMAAEIYFEEIFFYKGIKTSKFILSDKFEKVFANSNNLMKSQTCENNSPKQLLPIWIFFWKNTYKPPIMLFLFTLDHPFLSLLANCLWDRFESSTHLSGYLLSAFRILGFAVDLSFDLIRIYFAPIPIVGKVLTLLWSTEIAHFLFQPNLI